MKDLSDLLLETGAIKFGDFTLTSGKKSSFYVDVKKASTRPAILKIISDMMTEHIGIEDRLAGMELGAVPIVVGLALASGKDYLIIRKGKRDHGTGKGIEGEFKPGERILIVEDVATTGGSVIKTAEILRQAGLIVDRSLVVVDREEGASEALEAVGIKLIPLVRITELMEHTL